MKRKILEILGSVLGVVLFSAAVWVLHHQLRHHHYRDIVEQLKAIPNGRLLMAFFFTMMSYLALSGYDLLALRYIRHKLPYAKVALTSFITYAVSHNLGFSLFTGGSIRYRLYGAWGLSAFEITSLIGFGVMTFWLGYLTSGAAAFILLPPGIPPEIHVPFTSTRLLGILFCLILAAYLAWIIFLRRPIRIKGWQIEIPTPKLTISQMFLGAGDWAVASAALYMVLPSVPGLTYTHVLGVFLLSQIIGLISNVPGGLGVFESVFIVLIGPVASPAALIGSLVAYRLIYYLAPLSLAALSLGGYEVYRRKEELWRLTAGIGRWVPLVAPQLLSVTTFLSGVVLLFSGATPAVPQRMLWLERFLPLPIIELSHFIGSILGLGLLLLARGLQRRIDAAYLLSAVLLAGGIVVSLLKGFDYEEALILGVMLAVLLPARPYFYRKSSLLGRSMSPTWTAAVLVIIVSSAWLVIFSYKHIGYAHELWWQFSLEGDAPRSLRALAGVVALGVLVAFAKLLRPAAPPPHLPQASDLNGLAPVVTQSPDSTANLVYLGDKDILVSPSSRAFLMYAVSGRSWVALGDPVGPKEDWKELMWQFQELCDRHGGWTVFYQVRAESLPLYLDLGLTMLKMGEEGRVDLGTFSLDGHANKQLRHWHRTPESEGCTFEVVPTSGVSSLLPELRPISNAWLAHKHTREKRFSLGRFDETYLRRFPMGLVRHHGKPAAFANIWAGDNHEEVSFDLMRHLPAAPAGVMDFLLIELMLWGKQQGYQWFNLGMAPFSGLDRYGAGSLWNQWGTFLYRHGEYFYNFQGLRRYKEKFRPVWQPRYLASPGGIATFRVLTQVAALISGGITGVATK